MDWYYAVGDQQVGPIGKADLQALVKAKKINAQTRVWRTGMKEWQELGQLLKANQTLPAGISPGSGRSRQAQCNECGNSFPQDDMIRFADTWVCASCKPLFVQKFKEGLHVTAVLDYAGFWIRFGAVFIDGIILTVFNLMMEIPMVYFMFQGSADSSAFGPIRIIASLIQFMVPVAYTTWLLGKYGATLGKMACRIKVVTSDGGSISYARALGRHFAKWISWMTFGIGFIMAAFDDQKRTLHDRICDTRVIRRSQ
jgi:uncharacterized RDD family membrane protein YckC